MVNSNLRCNTTENGYKAHPWRHSGRTYGWAEVGLTIFKLAPSQVSFSPVRCARHPSRRVSVTTPENSKFAPGFVLLPLQASSHSRSWPRDRGSVLGGCW